MERGEGTRVVSQESCKFRPLYVPILSKHRPKYRAPTFSVDIRMAQPAAENMMGAMMCHVDSTKCPHDQARAHAPM